MRSCERQRGLDGIQWIVEFSMNTVARHFHDAAMVRLDGSACDRIVPGQGRTHPRRVLLPQAGAALDVGEEKGGNRGAGLHAQCLPEA